MKYNRQFFEDSLLNISLDSPLDAHLEWAAKKILLTRYAVQKDLVNGICRPFHGAQHAGRVAVYIAIIANLYRKYGDVDAWSMSAHELKLVQIAAIFHDSGREADGPDEWEHDSASNLYMYLTVTLEIAHEEAKILCEAIINKDVTEQNVYFTIKSVNKNGVEWEENYTTPKKSMYAKLIGSADCLDIIRARYVFKSNHLDFFRDFSANHELSTFLDDLATVVTEVRSLIETQGDSCRRHLSEIKKCYEHQPEKLMKLIVDDIQKGCLAGTNKLLRPALSALYNNGTLVSEAQSNNLVITQIPAQDDDLLIQGLSKGKVFARGIRTPSFILAKNAEKQDKITETDPRYQESLAECEIRKNTRNPDTPTASKRLGKSGNENRSTALLGWGASTYTASGLLIYNNSFSAIKRVIGVIRGTGYGKKPKFKSSDPDQIQEQFEILECLIKLGGMGELSGTYMATYNEVVLDITQEMIAAVYYTLDSNKINAQTATAKGFPLHYQAPILEAIYIQRAYFLKTGCMLPIYEYSEVHNYLHKRQFDNAQIIQLWRGLISDHLFSNRKKDSIAYDDSSINQLKIEAMYSTKRGLKDRAIPVDVNYDDALKAQVSEVIQHTLKEYDLFLAVAADNISQVEDILQQHPNQEVEAVLNRTNSKGQTVISYAVSLSMLRFLKPKVQPTPIDYEFLTYKFRESVEVGDLEAVQTLLSFGCDPNNIDSVGDTALIDAAYLGNVTIMEVLLRAGADAFIQGEQGLTACSWAARYGQLSIIEKMLAYNRDIVGAVNKDGTTAISYAKTYGTLALLIGTIKITKIDRKRLNDQMFQAFEKKQTHGIIWLVNAGADVFAKNSEGKTFAELVEKCKSHELLPVIQRIKLLKLEAASKKPLPISNRYSLFALQVGQEETSKLQEQGPLSNGF